MISLLVAAYLACPITLMVNETKDPWNKEDFKVLNTANTRCGEIYQDSPCVKKFYKKEEQSYWVICGK